MKSELVTTAMILALALPACAGDMTGLNMAASSESITDKAAVVAAVGASFDYLAAAIEGAADDKIMEATEMFGLGSVRAVLIFTLAHCHEHLGQSIAYARSNGVTPPWSM